MNNKYYPMNSAEVLDQVLDIYKKSFLKQVAVSIIFSIIFIVLLYIFLFAGIVALMVGFYDAFNEASLTTGAIISIAIFLMIIVLLAAIYDALLNTGNALITKHTFLGEYCDVGGVLKETFKKFWIAVSASLASLIVFIPVFFIGGVIVYLYIDMLVNFYGTGYMPTTPIIVFTILLLVLVLVISLIGTTVIMMSNKVAIFEGRWFFGAVKRSFILVKPDFMKIMGLVTVWSLIITAASYSLEAFFAVGTALAGYFAPQEAAGLILMSTWGVGSIFSMITGIVLAPLWGIFSAVVYINQRIKLEGLDIELSLNMLEVKRLNDIRTGNAKGSH